MVSRRRLLRSVCTLAAGCAAWLVLRATPSVLASTPPETLWTTPRTPWGDPDVQGIWDSKTVTPLQRPQEFTGREFLTDDDVARIEDAAAKNPGAAERNEAAAEACGSRIRGQAATGSWTRPRQWETQRTWFRSEGSGVCLLAKVNGVRPFNDAWERAWL